MSRQVTRNEKKVTPSKIRKQAQNLQQQIITEEKPIFASSDERESFDDFTTILKYLSTGYYTVSQACGICNRHYTFCSTFVQSHPELKKYYEKSKHQSQVAQVQMLEKANNAFQKSLEVTSLKKKRKIYEVVNGRKTVVQEIEDIIEQGPNQDNIRMILNKMTPLFSDNLTPVQLGQTMLKLIQHLANAGHDIQSIIPDIKDFTINYSTKKELPMDGRVE